MLFYRKFPQYFSLHINIFFEIFLVVNLQKYM